MKYKKEILIGLTVLIASLLLFAGLNFLKGSTFLSKDYLLHAQYANVAGLAQSDPVMLNGYKIGQVDKIRFSPDNDGSLMVTIRIINDFPIPDNSIAKIVNTSITGSKGIEIVLGNSSSYLRNEDKIQSGLDPSLIDSLVEELMPLKDKVEYLVERLERTTSSVNAILNEETQQNLILSIESFRVIMQTVAAQRNNIDAIMINARNLTADLEEDRKELSKILNDLSKTTGNLAQADLAQTIRKFDDTVTAIDSLVQQIHYGDGTFGKLITEDSLHTELTKSIEQLHSLLEDIQRNPKRYVKFSLF